LQRLESGILENAELPLREVVQQIIAPFKGGFQLISGHLGLANIAQQRGGTQSVCREGTRGSP
jgi:hypothetical protein